MSNHSLIPRCPCCYQYRGIMHYYAAGIMEYFSHYWRLHPPCHRIYTICFFFLSVFFFSYLILWLFLLQYFFIIFFPQNSSICFKHNIFDLKEKVQNWVIVGPDSIQWVLGSLALRIHLYSKHLVKEGLKKIVSLSEQRSVGLGVLGDYFFIVES